MGAWLLLLLLLLLLCCWLPAAAVLLAAGWQKMLENLAKTPCRGQLDAERSKIARILKKSNRTAMGKDCESAFSQRPCEDFAKNDFPLYAKRLTFLCVSLETSSHLALFATPLG